MPFRAEREVFQAWLDDRFPFSIADFLSPFAFVDDLTSLFLCEMNGKFQLNPPNDIRKGIVMGEW